ncbi:hypothetical protein [Serinicoccus sp. LYQ131]|uniref:hypothetical protein n=1 Tax=Serinicoccus sp. LYQ131 TaxID=3378797 RepID=UPI0038534367
MAREGASWHIENPMPGKIIVLWRFVLAGWVFFLVLRVWEFLVGTAPLWQVVVNAVLVVATLPALRAHKGWTVRADEKAVHLPRVFRRHIPWEGVKDIRPDARPPWGNSIVVVLHDDREAMTGLPPDNEGLREYWQEVTARRSSSASD